MTSYEIWLRTPRGLRLKKLDNFSYLIYGRILNQPGWATIGLPDDFDKNLLSLDNIIEIRRKPTGGNYTVDFTGFLRSWTFTDHALVISGPGINELLSRRIVAYAAGSAEAAQTDYADDMLKEIFDHNLGADATDADRQLDGFGLTSAAQLGLGPEITKSFAKRNVLEIMQEISEASRQAGTELYFDIIPGYTSSNNFTGIFTTWITQPGADRTARTPAPVFFGSNYGNMSEAVLTYDHTDEITVVYAGGAGEEENREVVEREDTTRSGASIWNRREGWRDARGEIATAALNSAGDSFLAEGRPKIIFTGNLLDTNQSRYGVDWAFGDRVTCRFADLQFDALIKSVMISIDGEGNETIEARAEVEL